MNSVSSPLWETCTHIIWLQAIKLHLAAFRRGKSDLLEGQLVWIAAALFQDMNCSLLPSGAWQSKSLRAAPAWRCERLATLLSPNQRAQCEERKRLKTDDRDGNREMQTVLSSSVLDREAMNDFLFLHEFNWTWFVLFSFQILRTIDNIPVCMFQSHPWW